MGKYIYTGQYIQALFNFPRKKEKIEKNDIYYNFLCDNKHNFHDDVILHTEFIKHNIVLEKYKKI